MKLGTRCAALALCASALASGSALAWESGAEDHPGPLAARDTWSANEPTNEHAILLRVAMHRAGIPEKFISDTYTLTVFADRTATTIDGRASVKPVPLDSASARRFRQFTVPGFAGLPDHSYALWDWASGNESCPEDTVEGTELDGEPEVVACHSFASHLGVLNSTHFPPQSERMYDWYHGLALERAKACAALQQRFAQATLNPSAQQLAESIAKDCVAEALSLEAIGQHFLQDAWAMGHMWERWGAPTFSQIGGGDSTAARQMRALLAGLAAGMIHGTDASLGRLPPDWSPVRPEGDQMSAGESDDVDFRVPGSSLAHDGIGDVYLGKFLSDERYAVQRQRLLDCSVIGLRRIYDETGSVADRPAELTDPGASDCFAQRATNRAMKAGLGMMDMLSTKAALLVAVKEIGTPPSPDVLLRFNLEFALLVAEFEISTWLDPEGITLAQQSVFMGLPPNSALLATPPAPYSDPAHGEDASVRQPAERTRMLARVFHRSRAAEWCEDTEASPSVLIDRLRDLPSGSADLEAAVAACEEFVQRHARIGNSPSVCEAATGRSQSASFTAEADVTDIAAAARRACNAEGPRGGLRPAWEVLGTLDGTVTCVDPFGPTFGGTPIAQGLIRFSSSGTMSASGCLAGSADITVEGPTQDNSYGIISESGRLSYQAQKMIVENGSVSGASFSAIWTYPPPTVGAPTADVMRYKIAPDPGRTTLSPVPSFDTTARAREVFRALDGARCNLLSASTATQGSASFEHSTETLRFDGQSLKVNSRIGEITVSSTTVGSLPRYSETRSSQNRADPPFGRWLIQALTDDQFFDVEFRFDPRLPISQAMPQRVSMSGVTASGESAILGCWAF